jgi:DNA-3-methyladenine glycosylase II
MKSLSFELRAVPPFRLDLTAWALRRRPHNTVDRWDGTSWRRVLVIDNEPLETAVKQRQDSERARLKVTLSGNHISEHAKRNVSTLLRQMFGLRNDLTAFYRLAAQNRRLAPLAQRFNGLKPPRFPSVFEGLVNAIACQQLSISTGIMILNRLAKLCGPTVSNEGTLHYGFPQPADILRLSPDTLRSIGFSFAKARSLLEVAQVAESGRLQQENLKKLNDPQLLALLMAFPGIGRWTAEYTLLRGLGRIDVFPGDDVGARNRLAEWLGRVEPMDYHTVQRAVRPWHPYSGFVYFHLLLRGLAESKVLPEHLG